MDVQVANIGRYTVVAVGFTSRGKDLGIRERGDRDCVNNSTVANPVRHGTDAIRSTDREKGNTVLAHAVTKFTIMQ